MIPVCPSPSASIFFFPLPHNPCTGGSGAHAHISLHDTSPRDSSPPQGGPGGLSPKESSFVAGVLAHLPALAALALPTAASYTRMVDHVWSGGTYVCWGGNNREAPLRVCGAPGSKHIELKALDGTANPYIALAGVLGAGVLAIERGASLDIGEATRPAALMSEGERAALNIRDRLPSSIKEARERLTQDEIVLDLLGEIGKVWNNVNEVWCLGLLCDYYNLSC
jgi:glutamine synthetase